MTDQPYCHVDLMRPAPDVQRCSICFRARPVDQLFVDGEGTVWDVCGDGRCAGQAGLVRTRILITGSRTVTDRAAVERALSGLLGEFGSLVIVHGDCPQGADRLAREWAERMIADGMPVEQERCPADWSQGRGAGFARNSAMVATRPDLCLTFIERCADRRCQRTEPHGSHGSVHCATEAARAGIPVRHILGP